MNNSDLRLLRSRLGFTQARLAQAVDVTPNTVARWERGELPIPSRVVPRLYAVAEGGPSGSAITRPQGVIKDPHHRAILEAISGHLDPEVFEACSSELVRKEGWRAVPVRGGRDGGFDGAVADGAGEPFPLVITTGQRPLENLRQNLGQVRRNNHQIDRAIFATSRRVTPSMRGKLSGAANELGFDLVQIYDQDWFAYRLYRNPDWCKRLLGVTGRPRALSVFPKSQRPTPGNEVIGREKETRWLMSRRSDCLVIGVPGSGKTFLLRSLALHGQGLFLVDDDREQIANDLRNLQPGAVIIDDAHVGPDLIETFAQVRREVGAEHIPIIATCWPSEAPTVQSALQVASGDVLTLELIDADTMVKIIKAAGIEGPNKLIAAIRQQADGRPGLAATLANLCLQGDIRQVITGEALIDQLVPGLSRMLGLDSKWLLAPFALGGDGGLKQTNAARLLRKSDFDIGSNLAHLAAAGVVRERPNRAVSVEPGPMRWALVRDVFFGGAGSLDYAPFLQVAESRQDLLETLIGALSRGASIPDLLSHIETEASANLWSAYASVGPRETEYVIENHSELAAEIAEAGLVHAPHLLIPKLLDQVREEHQDFAFSRYDPLKTIETWVLNPYTSAGEILYRRSALVRAAKQWWKRTGDTRTAVRGMCIALSPKLAGVVSDPGAGRTIKLTRGLLPVRLLRELVRLWPIAMEIMRDTENVPWDEIDGLVWEWRYGSPSNADLPEETLTMMADFAERMLRDLSAATRQHPGIQHRLREMSKMAGMKIQLVLDPEFNAVYPEKPVRTLDDDAKIAKGLTGRWANKSIAEIAEILARIETEARPAGVDFPPLQLTLFCQQFAEIVSDPVIAAEAFMEQKLAGDLVRPFVYRAASKNHPAWTSLVRRCIGEDMYEADGIAVIITIPEPPQEMLLDALARAGKMSHLIEWSCLSGRVPETTLEAMFRWDDPRVAFTAAIGHWRAWHARRTGIFGESQNEFWRQAILSSAGFEYHNRHGSGYWLSEILSTNGGLAADWMLSKMRSGESSFYLSVEQLAGKAIAAMNFRQRSKVLKGIPGNLVWMQPEIIQLLVGKEMDLYRELLDSRVLARFHLAPLAGQPDRFWLQKAILALNAGYSADQIIDSTLTEVRVWQGDESKMWAERRIAFEALGAIQDSDLRVSRLARRGAEIMGEYETQALERDRYESVHVVS